MSPSQCSLPLELWDAILDQLHSDPAALRVAALVCRTWVPTSRFHLFEALVLSPKCARRAAHLNVLLASRYSTIGAAIRILSLPGALTPIQVRSPRGNIHLTTLLGLAPHLAQLPRLRELTLSDFPCALLDGLTTVRRLTFTDVCAGTGLLRSVHALPHLTHLALEGVAAVPYRGGACPIKNNLRNLAIRRSSLACLGWVYLAAPQVVSLSIDTVVAREMPYLREYLSAINSTLENLELTYFDADPLSALALPAVLDSCTALKTLRLNFPAVADVRRFFTFGCHSTWPPEMCLEIVVNQTTPDQCEAVKKFFIDWSINVRLVV
ncbi:hypothetical protein B0H16DRAFT_1390434 [Mycena metata]|uniref:F-box domain-containing protein n=1 Tax=Mycena metata TaxID=1033252 RepID=A0AAD7MF37_9AGAR|nr:hypothetical protein B0H16DRAFT_1390434 [Mycena metata]